MVNAGSTSLKVAVFDRLVDDDAVFDDPAWSVDVESADVEGSRVTSFEQVLRTAPDLAAVTVVGHRVVHGGRRFGEPVVIDAEVEAEIAALEELAPLHNRAALDGVVAARQVVAPDTPHVAVFDTAFHGSLAPAAAAYGGPYEWFDQGLRRYGFHGISHDHAARAAAVILDRPLQSLRLVTCHLGGGCSLAAVEGGRSVDTTMGFTPLDGLVMATRAGAVDPGLIFHLLRSGSTPDELESLLEKRSGLLGLSGRSADLRQVIAARDAGEQRAGLAVDVFVHRVTTGVGAMLAALGGADAIVFTGGIGEHSAEVRARVSDSFGFLGVALDEDRNQGRLVDADLSSAGATVAVVVVAAREELAIARSAVRVALD